MRGRKVTTTTSPRVIIPIADGQFRSAPCDNAGRSEMCGSDLAEFQVDRRNGCSPGGQPVTGNPELAGKAGADILFSSPPGPVQQHLLSHHQCIGDLHRLTDISQSDLRIDAWYSFGKYDGFRSAVDPDRLLTREET